MTEEFVALFEMLEDFVRAKFATDGPVRVDLILMASGSDETGYFVYLVGGTDLEERYHPAAGCTTAEGTYEPGVYLVFDCTGGAVLMPENKISVGGIINAAPWRCSGGTEDDGLHRIMCSVEEYLRKNSIEPPLSAEDEPSSHGLHMVQ